MLVRHMKYFLNLVNFGSHLLSLEWDDKSNKIKRSNSSKCARLSLIGYLHNLTTCVVLLQAAFLKPVATSDNILSKILLGLIIINLLISGSFLRTCKKTLGEMILCINGYLQFIQVHRKGNKFF